MLDNSLFNEATPLSPYRANVWRVVESQEHAATLQVIDDLAEQTMLEAMLDQVKPKYRSGTEDMHYLLKTAFRYPPLKWGSRFGTRLMPSYLYASETPGTALCECAYYRFLFLEHMQTPYLAPIRSEYCLFKVSVTSNRCLDLTTDIYKSIQTQLRDPSNYAATQEIGNWVYQRTEDESKPIDVIRFGSARTSQSIKQNTTPIPGSPATSKTGINIAVAEPSAINSRQPIVQQRWLCLTKPSSVSFSSRDSEISYLFPKTDFCDSDDRFLYVV